MIELGVGFHPDLTGRENIYLNTSLYGISGRETDADLPAIVDSRGWESSSSVPVKNYSTGMYVRLGFSVAVHLEPDVLLVDEVLAVGDAHFQQKCLERIEKSGVGAPPSSWCPTGWIQSSACATVRVSWCGAPGGGGRSGGGGSCRYRELVP